MVELCKFPLTYLNPDLIYAFFRGLDFAPANSSHLNDDAPIIVVQHGLTGGEGEAITGKILFTLGPTKVRTNPISEQYCIEHALLSWKGVSATELWLSTSEDVSRIVFQTAVFEIDGFRRRSPYYQSTTILGRYYR